MNDAFDNAKDDAAMLQKLTVCPDCDGRGYYEGHAASCDGNCINCPEQVQCERCFKASLPEPKRCTVFKVVLEVVCPDEEDNCPDEKDVRDALAGAMEEEIHTRGWKSRIKDVQPWATGEAVPE